MSKIGKKYSSCVLLSKNLLRGLGLIFSVLCIILPLETATSQPEINPAVKSKDDSELIIERIKDSLAHTGLISIEQNTGRILFNPVVDKLHSMPLKQKFILPALVVNQQQGLILVGELPFSCFMVGGGDLSSDNYKGFRQHETIRYIREVKDFTVSRALICETVGAASKQWKNHLSLNIEAEPFVFEEHVSLKGEHFYYFLNVDGSFEMYM
jgi:hypothetical protein